MKRCFFLAIFCLCQIGHAHSFILELENFFENFYKTDFKEASKKYKNLLDNGYYFSAKFTFNKDVDGWSVLGNKIEDPIIKKQLIKDVLLTVFAYATPTSEQKENMALRILNGLNSDTFNSVKLYTMNSRNFRLGTYQYITESCEVYTPSKVLAFVDMEEDTNEGKNPVVYILASDVCD